MLEANMMKVLRKIVDKTKIDRIRSQQIIESCGINEWVKRRRRRRRRRRREWDQHVKEWMKRLVKISRDSISVGKRSPKPLKKDGAT